MSKIKEKWYIAKYPGYSIALPDGLKYQEVIGGLTRTRTVLTFHAKGGKMVKTSQTEIQNFLNNSIAMKRGLIMHVESPADIAERKKREEQEARLRFWKDIINKPGMTVNFRSMSDSELRQEADLIGADTSSEGKKLSKDEVAANIEILVFGEVQKGKKAE